VKLGAVSTQPHPVVVFLPDRQAFPAKAQARPSARLAPTAEVLWTAASSRDDDALTPAWQASIFTLGKLTADAIVAHARSGGSQKIASLIGAAGQFELLAKEAAAPGLARTGRFETSSPDWPSSRPALSPCCRTAPKLPSPPSISTG
jgi:hypothetical protein